MTTVYSRHPDLRVTEVDGEGVVLHLGSRQYFSVNETGVTILGALAEPRSLEELVTAVTDVYDVTSDVAEQSVRRFLDRCGDAKLLLVGER
ncbi:MAG: PqqD family protein [bacterium]